MPLENDYMRLRKKAHRNFIKNSEFKSAKFRMLQVDARGECWNATSIKSAAFAMTKCHELYFAATFCRRNAFPFNVLHFFSNVFINLLQHTVELVSLWKGRNSLQKQIEKDSFHALLASFIYLCVSKEKFPGFRKGSVLTRLLVALEMKSYHQ